MKKILLIIAALTIGGIAFSNAQVMEQYQSYINVNGKSEREVVPNEIHMRIVIDEADTKGKTSVADQERRMIAELKALGINTDKDLQVGDMSGDLQTYVLRKDKVQTSKSYILKVGDAATLARAFQTLGDMNISQMGIIKATRNDLEEIRMEMRVEAMKNAREIADALAGAIGQKAGKAFNISDNNYGGGGVIYYDTAPMLMRSKAEAAVDQSAGNSIEFQNLKLTYNVSVNFILQ